MEPMHSKCMSHDPIAVDGSLGGDGSSGLKSNGSGSSISMPKFVGNHHAMLKHQLIDAAIQQQSPQQHQLVSTNSFELNGMTSSSLSDDSGLPLTTNSSISSGDSSRFGLCKSAFEVSDRIHLAY